MSFGSSVKKWIDRNSGFTLRDIEKLLHHASFGNPEMKEVF